MYFWNTYPFVRLSIALILGIVSLEHFPYLWSSPITSIAIALPLLVVFILIAQRKGYYQLRHVVGGLSLFLIFFIGGWAGKLQYQLLPTHHYTKIDIRATGFSGTVVSTVNERTNHYRYDVQLSRLVDEDTTINSTGIVHLYIKKDSLTQRLSYGDVLHVASDLQVVPAPDNPSEFNYKQYLRRQNIYSHSFATAREVKVVRNEPPNRILSFAYHIREQASEVINQNIAGEREQAIAQALLLGIKDHLDNDIKKAYSSAGAMHVLAVSGLHVGIIYLILQMLFGSMRNKGKWGRRLFGLICVLSIWLYALITGMSPSVMRAAVMFSLVAISQVSSREGNIYNTLGFAAFLLLLYDPYLIYSVGFQLSFIAVLGIVYLQPRIYRLFDFNSTLLDKAWAITCVSIAAQLATFPLSAFYFHQFPTYFLVSNLVVIPAAFIMLITGISMLLLYPIVPQVASVLGTLLSAFMWLVNESISLVDQLPHSLIEWIHLDRPGLILTYAIILSLISGLHYRSFKTLFITAVLLVTFMGWKSATYYYETGRKQLIFYEIRDKTAIDLIDGHSATFYIDEFESDELELLSFQVNPNRLSYHLPPITHSITLLDSVLGGNTALKFGQIGGLKMVIFDSTTFHLNIKSPIESDIVLINNEAVKSLKWLTEHFKARRIIIGSKNSYYYSRKMKKQGKKLNLDVHALRLDGALILAHKKRADKLPALFTTNPD